MWFNIYYIHTYIHTYWARHTALRCISVKAVKVVYISQDITQLAVNIIKQYGRSDIYTIMYIIEFFMMGYISFF